MNNEKEAIAELRKNKNVYFKEYQKSQNVNLNFINFESLCSEENIKHLDEPMQRNAGEFEYYCMSCEIFVRNRRHIKEHIDTREHLAHKGILSGKQRLKELFKVLKKNYRSPTPAHIDALNRLYSDHFTNNDAKKKHKKDAQLILQAIQNALDDSFGSETNDGKPAVQVYLTGSMFTSLCTPSHNLCDMNTLVKFSEKLSKKKPLSFLYNQIYDAINKVAQYLPGTSANEQPAIQKISSKFCPAFLQFRWPIKRRLYNITVAMGEFAEKAHTSNRLVLAYLRIWPPLKQLMRFVRHWARINCLNNCVTNFAFDLLVIHYAQQTHYLPVLNEFISEHLAVRDVAHLCEMPDEEFIQSCHQLQTLYYGEKIPSLSPGQMIYGFFKYFITTFDSHFQCKIDVPIPLEKPLFGRKHFMVIDPFLDVNVMKVRLEVYTHIWDCLIKSAAYICIPSISQAGLLYNITYKKFEFELKKSLITYWRVMDIELDEQVKNEINNANHDYEYSLSELLCHQQPLPIFCSFCHKSGHLEPSCQFIRPHQFVSAPICRKLSKEFTNAILKQYESTKLSKYRHKRICAYIDYLMGLLRGLLKIADLKLTPFGSMINGFGSLNADLDLCLETKEITITNDQLIRNISSLLTGQGYKTEHILTAKVPIVKFENLEDGFKGDISIGNCLALKNSEMLKVYAELDKRVAPLGLFIKHWARINDLNNSANGSFSSYALIIMLIAFLQRGCSPPVLPFLQELAADSPREFLDGFDVTFARSKRCPSNEKNNKKSVAELFVGFLQYYFGVFDPHLDVVQIRQTEPLMKMDKVDGRRWDQYTFCVEDPFDLVHNLTAGVKIEVLFNFYKAIEKTLNLIELLDRRMDQQNESMECLFHNSDCNNGMSMMSKLFPV